MSTAERKKFFLKALEEQRHLLKTAVNGMASGDLVQALHVATSVRVLVHETGASKPLLKHLRTNYLELPILEAVVEPPKAQGPGLKAITFFTKMGIEIFGAPDAPAIGLGTDLGRRKNHQSTLGAWWNGACAVLPGVGPVSRRDVILGLANKEGGAHVDAKITHRYQQLLASQFLHIKVNNTDFGPLNSCRLLAGTCGVELLDCLSKNFPPPQS